MAEGARVLPFPQRAATPAPMPAASSFGMDESMLGPAFDAKGLVNSERVRELQYRDAFFAAKHHDWKLFDMSGRLIRPGRMGTQPLLSSSVPTHYVPLDQRRPGTPYRLARKIVTAFTGFVFGHGRFPQFRSDDPDTEDWATALAEAMGLEVQMIRARNLGGRTGTVGLSWAFVGGEPRVRVHRGFHIHVIEWEDEDERIPAHVVELYQAPSSVHAGKRQWFWWRRDWTRDADVVFRPQPVGQGSPSYWEIDQEQSFEHGDGYCHFVWVENLPDDDDESGVDGASDYAETYESQMSLDLLSSVNVRGASANLDPTLVLAMEQDLKLTVVRKGSDNAISVGSGGSASYLELSGQSIAAGSALVQEVRSQILEVSECVVPDPNTVAAAGTSAVALRMIYAPMLQRCDVYRWQYGRAITRLLTQMTDSARRRMPNLAATDAADRYAHVPVFDEDGNEVGVEPVEVFVVLPPRIVTEPELTPDGTPTGDLLSRKIERAPGGGRIWLEWGPYFKPTADDDQKEAGALSLAAGGAPVLSQQTAVELLANSRDRDGTREWARVKAEAAEKARLSAVTSEGMFPGIGGAVPPAAAPEDFEE
jgi:hypothetical protein